MAKLNVSDKVSLPVDAVTQTMACIGRKGAGKTYLAQLLAEQMLNAEAQVVVVDPVGNWWGLRVDADGKAKGKDIFIAGGERGDVPILPESGARFARLVTEKTVPLILDVSRFRKNERKRFAADFAEEFFHLKKTQKSAVHLFVEEAQLFVPQMSRPDDARMLGAFEDIVRLGRNYGIGATLISQRPQSVNKEVLSQVECLCVLQVNGTHERKALEEWVQEAGADRKLVGQLPGLARGEGYIWSPSWLRVFERVNFGKKTTFDASATPEVGKATKAALLTAVDVEALKSDLQEVIASAEKDDPKVLRRQIVELQRQLAIQPKQASTEEVRMLQDTLKQLKSEADEMEKQLGAYQERFKKASEIAQSLVSILTDISPAPVHKYIEVKLSPLRLKPESEWPKPEQPRIGDVNLRAGARRMLSVLCQWHPAGRTEAQVAAQVQMKRTSGTWAAYKSDMRNGGYFEIRDGLWFATTAGLAYIGSDAPEMPSTTQEVVDLWSTKLRAGARNMLAALIHHRGRIMSREELGQAVELEHTSGTFSAYLSDLKQAGLILVDRDGIRANKETLFL